MPINASHKTNNDQARQAFVKVRPEALIQLFKGRSGTFVEIDSKFANDTYILTTKKYHWVSEKTFPTLANHQILQRIYQ